MDQDNQIRSRYYIDATKIKNQLVTSHYPEWVAGDQLMPHWWPAPDPVFTKVTQV